MLGVWGNGKTPTRKSYECIIAAHGETTMKETGMRASLDEQAVKTQSKLNAEAVYTSVPPEKQSHKAKSRQNQEPAYSGESNVNGGLFIRPFKEVVIDCGFYFIVNTIMIYTMLFVVPDSSIAMLSIAWVAIIAWRGGFLPEYSLVL
jgi:hypothetical protein